MGYHQAGFTEIVGVDSELQPNYPFEFIQADVMAFESLQIPRFVEQFDLIHASPPCQAFSVYGNNKGHVRDDHPDLIEPTRSLLQASGVPYVIENVPGAPLDPTIQLCGTSFGIEVRRHRLFEASFPMLAPPCDHGRFTERKYPGSSNRPNGRTVMNVGEWRVPFETQKRVMEMPWVTNLREIAEAIPPAYTKFIGEAFLAQVEVSA